MKLYLNTKTETRWLHKVEHKKIYVIYININDILNVSRYGQIACLYIRLTCESEAHKKADENCNKCLEGHGFKKLILVRKVMVLKTRFLVLLSLSCQ